MRRFAKCGGVSKSAKSALYTAFTLISAALFVGALYCDFQARQEPLKRQGWRPSTSPAAPVSITKFTSFEPINNDSLRLKSIVATFPDGRKMDMVRFDESTPLAFRSVNLKLTIENPSNRLVALTDIIIGETPVFEMAKRKLKSSASLISGQKELNISISLPVKVFANDDLVYLKQLENGLVPITLKAEYFSVSEPTSTSSTRFDADFSEVMMEGLNGDLMTPVQWKQAMKVCASGQPRGGKSCLFGTVLLSVLSGTSIVKKFEVADKNNHTTWTVQEFHTRNLLPRLNVILSDIKGDDNMLPGGGASSNVDKLQDRHRLHWKGMLELNINASAPVDTQIRPSIGQRADVVIFVVPFGMDAEESLKAIQKPYAEAIEFGAQPMIFITGDWQSSVPNLSESMVRDFPFVKKVAEALNIPLKTAHERIVLSPDFCAPGFVLTPKWVFYGRHMWQMILRMGNEYDSEMNWMNSHAKTAFLWTPKQPTFLSVYHTQLAAFTCAIIWTIVSTLAVINFIESKKKKHEAAVENPPLSTSTPLPFSQLPTPPPSGDLSNSNKKSDNNNDSKKDNEGYWIVARSVFLIVLCATSALLIEHLHKNPNIVFY